MKRSTYMFIALVVLGYALVPFMVDRDNKYELSLYRIEGEYESKDFLQKSNIVICGNTQHLRNSTKINVIIEAYEEDSIRCEYESDWGKYLSFDTNNDTLKMKVLFDKMREMEGLDTYFELYSNDIKLKVPRKMLKVVDASKLSRHLNLTLLNFDDDRLETKSRGELTLKDCKIKILRKCHFWISLRKTAAIAAFIRRPIFLMSILNLWWRLQDTLPHLETYSP